VNAAIAFSIELHDEAMTADLAARLARRAQRGDVVLLSGDLGSGKTSFARAFIRARGTGREEVPSPTFTLVEVYAPGDGTPVWHFDLYRLTASEEAYELGIEEAFGDGISLIEWPDRLGSLLPPEHLEVTLSPGTRPEARVARLSGTPGWAPRLAELARG
jgi:tRNA threonylcarbamoyladenosine biosynthesis protein TsaE